MNTITSKAQSESELKKELTALSSSHPESWFTFYACFGHVTIHQHDKNPGGGYGEDCYRTFGGFFKAGKIVKPSSSWIRQFNYIPCGDR